MNEDRVLPRFSRYLAEALGWTVTAAPEPGYDAYYLSAYFEAQLIKEWPGVPVAAYFTHLEEEPPGNAKARLFDSVAGRVQLRVATAGMYARLLEGYGLTVQVHPPVERERFMPLERTPTPSLPQGGREVRAGFSGYTYQNGRKGEDLAAGLVASALGQKVTWMASGRGWPVPTKRYVWKAMPGFYQQLDVLVCTALVEGVPMPPLEALACGVSVVVPRGVGLLDELPDTLGIHRYDRGDAADLQRAFAEAVEARGEVEVEALRAVTEPYTVQAWCAEHRDAMEGIAEQSGAGAAVMAKAEARPEPVERGTGSNRGIYCVAFGDPARACAKEMMASAKKHMPDIPIALCSDRAIGQEDVLIVQPDADIGGRRAKLRAYELAPAEWESVLYLDADTEVVAPVYQFFQWVEDGWELVICTDIDQTLHRFRGRASTPEMDEIQRATGSLHTQQLNGGVWAFRRCQAVKDFFTRWRAEYEKYLQRDQGALIRALYAQPLKIWLLGVEWNTFIPHCAGVKTAGIRHYPGKARRWEKMISGRLDGDKAWDAVNRFKRVHR
jgi:hypothetical protein